MLSATVEDSIGLQAMKTGLRVSLTWFDKLDFRNPGLFKWHVINVWWLWSSQTSLSDTMITSISDITIRFHRNPGKAQLTYLPGLGVLLGLDILSHWLSCAVCLCVQSVSALQETTTCFLFCLFFFLLGPVFSYLPVASESFSLSF